MFPLASSRTLGTALPRAAEAGGAFAGLPQLEAGAERLRAALVKALGAMAGGTGTGGAGAGVDGTLLGFRRLSLADHLAAHRPGSVASTLECTGVACTILLTQDAALVHALVELLCGGDGAECRPDETRQATAIDMQYAHTIATLTAGAIAGEWKERGFEAAKPVRIEGVPAPDICGARVRDVGVVSLAITVLGVRGLLTLALPPAALAAFGDEARKAPGPAADTAASDAASAAAWNRTLGREIGRAAVRVDVMLDALPLSLRQLSQLQPGQVIALPGDARTRAALVCDGRTLFRGEIGQDDERYSLRIDSAAARATPFTRSPSEA